MKFPRPLPGASHLPVERLQSFCHCVFLSRLQGVRNCPGLHGPWHRVLESLGREDAIGQTQGLRPGPEVQRPRVRDAGSAAEPKGCVRAWGGSRAEGGAHLAAVAEQAACSRPSSRSFWQAWSEVGGGGFGPRVARPPCALVADQGES